MQIQRLGRVHDRKSFDCGNEELNKYFREIVTQDIRNRMADCFVVTESTSKRVLGFYTLSMTALNRDLLPQDVWRSNYRMYPFALLGRLAVAVSHQGKGLGKRLVLDAVLRVADSGIGAMGMIVDMKSPDLLPFYLSCGFLKLNSHSCYLLFGPLKKLQSK